MNPIKVNQDKSICEHDQLKAAYALNLCTVSVSQIVDYKDLNVLEQEYELILNNLNLHNIPKDQALLHILRQILDTVTFFRIYEGDKMMLEKIPTKNQKCDMECHSFFRFNCCWRTLYFRYIYDCLCWYGIYELS